MKFAIFTKKLPVVVSVGWHEQETQELSKAEQRGATRSQPSRSELGVLTDGLAARRRRRHRCLLVSWLLVAGNRLICSPRQQTVHMRARLSLMSCIICDIIWEASTRKFARFRGGGLVCLESIFYTSGASARRDMWDGFGERARARACDYTLAKPVRNSGMRVGE